MQNQMLIMGLTLIGLFAALAIWRILKKNEKSPSLLEILLVLGGAVLCVLGLSVENGSDVVFDISEIAALAAGVGLAQIGLWGMWVRERPWQSRGLLALGTGIVLAAAALILPIYTKSTVTESVIDIAALSSEEEDAMTVLVSDTEQGASRMAVFSTPLPAGVPMAIPTLEVPRIVFATPTPTPALTENCEATVTTRLNMRHLPSTAAGEIITVIPEHTTVELYGHDDSGEWWFTIVEREEGWLHGGFLTLTEDCNRLPVRAWGS